MNLFDSVKENLLFWVVSMLLYWFLWENTGLQLGPLFNLIHIAFIGRVIYQVYYKK